MEEMIKLEINKQDLVPTRNYMDFLVEFIYN
jgi:hypothetical protein